MATWSDKAAGSGRGGSYPTSQFGDWPRQVLSPPEEGPPSDVPNTSASSTDKDEKILRDSCWQRTFDLY